MTDKNASMLQLVDATDDMILVASDPSIPAGPSKESVAIRVSSIRGSASSIVVDGTNSPYQASYGQTIFVDNTATSGLTILMPATFTTGASGINIIPLGDAAVNPFHVDPGTANVAGSAGTVIDVTSTNVSFQVRPVSATYGYGFFSLGSTYVMQQVTVNASDVVSTRYVESGDIQLLPSDREHAVASATDVSGGKIYLPLATDVVEGWQCTYIQEGNGTYTFELNASAVGESMKSLGNQFVTLGNGTVVTIILQRNKTWLLAGGLSPV